MASALAIKRRIKSVKSIAQVTKTMQIVAASRMKKVQESAQKLNPYSEALMKMLSKLSEDKNLVAKNPFFKKNDSNKNLIVLVSPNRSFAGALPSNLVSRTIKFIKSNPGNEFDFICVNKKGFNYIKRSRFKTLSYYENIDHKSSLTTLEPIVEQIKELFLSGEYSEIFISYSKFINTLKQESVVEKFLPISAEEVSDNELSEKEFLIEPSPEDLLNEIVPHYIEIQLFNAAINNSASEESARVIAMKNATDNANDMMDDLVLSYNKSRQMKITQQVAEISAAL